MAEDSVSLLFKINSDPSGAVDGIKKTTSALDGLSEEGKKVLERLSKYDKPVFDTLGKSANSSEKEISSLSSGVEGFVGTMGIAIGVAATFAAVVISIGKELFGLAKEASDAGSSIADFQAKTGLTAETISTLKYNAEQSGIAFDSLAAPIAKFTNLLFEAQQGGEKQIDTLKKLNVTDFNDLDKSLSQAIAAIHDAGSEVDKTGVAMEVFGTKSGAVMKAVADSVDGNLGSAIETAKKLGIVLSQEDVEAADAFGDTYELVMKQSSVATTEFAFGYMPKLTEALKLVSGELVSNQSVWRQWGNTIGDILERTANNAALFYHGLVDVSRVLFNISTLNFSEVSKGIGPEFNTSLKGYLDQRDLIRSQTGLSLEAKLNVGTPDFRSGGKAKGGGSAGRAAQDPAKKAEEERKKIVDAREDDDARLVKIRQNFEKEEKASLNKQLADKLLSETEYQEKVKQLAIDGLEVEKEILNQRLTLVQLNAEDRKKINEQIEDIDSQLAVEITEKETSAIKRKNIEIEKTKKITEEIVGLRRQVIESERESFDFGKEQERKILQNQADSSYGQDRMDALIVLREFDIAEADRKHKREIEDLEAEQKKAIDDLHERAKTSVELKVKEEEEKKVIEDKYKNLKNLSDQQNESVKSDISNGANQGIINQQKTKGTAGIFASIFGGLAGGGVEETDSQGKIKTQAEYMKGVYDDISKSSQAALGSMVGGLANLAQQWIVTGKISVRAAAQMVAGILASLAIEDGVHALHELAVAIALSANPLTAPLAAGHYAAATAYGIAAAEAGGGAIAVGIASRIGANDSASGAASSASSTSATSSGVSSDQKDRVIEESRNTANQDRALIKQMLEKQSKPQPINVNAKVEVKQDTQGHWAAQMVLESMRDAHELYDYTRQLISDNA